MEGVYRTRVGYAGGTQVDPTYYNLGDHTETLQLDYNPSEVSFEDLLELFWESHDPTAKPFSRQYMAIILYHDSEQEELAKKSKAALEASLNKPVLTEIWPHSAFYLAEDYHQKYYLQNRNDFNAIMKLHYPEFEDFLMSTAAARLNGYVGGYGSREQLAREIDSLGLSDALKELLMRFARN